MTDSLRTLTLTLGVLTALGLAGCPASSYDDDDSWGSSGGDYNGDDDDGPQDIVDPDGVSAPEDGEDTICDEAPTEPVTWFVSADDSNSMAQPTLFKRAIQSGNYIGANPRLYEFLNYYSFDFGPGNDVRLEPQLRRTEDGTVSLLVGVVAPDKSNNARRPLNLTFSLDLSGSMGSAGIAGMRAALRAIIAELREGDVVSMVEWSTSQTVLADSWSVQGPDDPGLLAIVSGLTAGGGTNLDAGLSRAYTLAQQNWSGSSLNRVILISDGGANVGVTSAELIAGHAEDGESDGIYLGAIGAGAIQERFMDTITDLGKGAYMYIDGEEEAARLLSGDRFLAAVDLAARDVQLELTLPEGVVIDHFSGEEISENPEEVRPQHLAPNDAMLYHFDLVDCMEEASGRQVGLQVTWLEPFTGNPQSTSLSVDWDELLAGPDDAVLKADAIVRYARIAGGEDLDAQLVYDAAAALPGDADLAEIRALTQQIAP
jgi:Ca-activated chloride channel homolog